MKKITCRYGAKRIFQLNKICDLPNLFIYSDEQKSHAVVARCTTSSASQSLHKNRPYVKGSPVKIRMNVPDLEVAYEFRVHDLNSTVGKIRT